MIATQKDDSLLQTVAWSYSNQGPITGLLGVMTYANTNWLCVITQHQQVGQHGAQKVNKVTQVKMFPYKDEAAKDPATLQTIEDVKQYLYDGFYFSFGYDLTCSRQRRIEWMQQRSEDRLERIAADKRYFWNYALYRDFLSQNIDTKWLTPLIQGYYSQAVGSIAGRPVVVTLISRRMRMRAGTRYNARGLDDRGFVGNQVEKEQLVFVDGRLWLSHVQVSGTVPVFWEQSGVKEDVTIVRTPQMTNKPFRLHMQDLTKTYGHVYCLNLLKLKSERECLLTNNYLRQIYDAADDFKLVKY